MPVLFQWFLDHYADVGFREGGGITPGTTFHELSVESLDYVEWRLEAEERFGVAIHDQDAGGDDDGGDYFPSSGTRARRRASNQRPAGGLPCGTDGRTGRRPDLGPA